MRIIENSPERLVARGVPGGAGGAWAALGIGLMLAGAFGGVSWSLAGSGQAFGAVMMLFGVVIGLLACSIGVGLLLTRESLVLDHAAGRGMYEKRPVGRPRMAERIEFDRASIAAVALERRDVVHGSRRDRIRTEQWRAVLRVEDPRRTLVLMESQNGRELPVRRTAVAVAEALRLPLTEDLADAGSLGEEVDTAEFTTRLASRAGGAIEIPPQPAGSRVVVEIDPDGSVVRLRWRIMGNNALPIIGLVIFGGWTVVSVLFLLAALGVVGGQGRAPAGVVAVTASFVCFGLVLMLPMVLLVSGAKRTVTVTPEAVTARSPVVLGNARVQRSEIKTVRTASGEDDAAIVYHGDGKTRIGLHLPVDGEVKWLAGALREAVRAMG